MAAPLNLSKSLLKQDLKSPTKEDFKSSTGAPVGKFSDCLEFASNQEKLIFISGILLAFMNGCTQACYGLVLGLGINAFDSRFTPEEKQEQAIRVTIYFVLLGVLMFIGRLGSRACLRFNAKRQGYKIRMAYFSALLQKDIDFYDKVNPMEMSSQVENDSRAIVDALDVKLEFLFITLGALVAGIGNAFFKSWEITLYVLIFIPLIVGSVFLYIKLVINAEIQRSIAYGKAGAVVEESLNNIKTVVSLGGEKFEVKRYSDAVKQVQIILSKAGFHQGLASGARQMAFYLLFACVLYIGSYKIERAEINSNSGEPYRAADVFTPISTMSTCFALLPTIGASLNAINIAKIKIGKILNIVKTVNTDKGEATQLIENFQGAIEFRNVCFTFPSRPEYPILENFNLSIKPGSRIALVGESGSGKSTVFQLLQEFYELDSGYIKLDGHELDKLDKSWLRKNIAYVSQEPTLFAMSIRENLLLAKEDATEDEMITALRKANADKFVMQLDKKLDTFLGGASGVQLSGGQKQRIAIARALLKDSKVLLLDEATSALDRRSERLIQQAVENLGRERTVIIIAHRLSTVQNVDRVIVLEHGKIVESGKYEELLEKQGKFYKLAGEQAHAEIPAVSTQLIEGKVPKNLEDKNTSDDDSKEQNDDNEETRLLGAENSGKEESKKKPEKASFADIKKIWNFTKVNKGHFLLGFLGYLGNSLLIPATNLFIPSTLNLFVHYDDPDFRQSINIFCGFALVSSVVVVFFYTLGMGYFAKASEAFIQSLRVDMFYKFLRMHIGWHEQHQNNPGTLAGSLQRDTSNVGQLMGTSVGLIIQILVTNLTVVIIAYVVNWKLSLIGMFLVPLVLFVAVKLNSNEARANEETGVLTKRAELIVSESLNNMKTLVSLNAEKKFLSNYCSTAQDIEEVNFRRRTTNGFYEGGMFFLLYLIVSGMYLLGTYLSLESDLAPIKVFIPVFTLSFTVMTSTQLFILMPDTGRALHSIQTLIKNIERKSEIDIEDKTNNRRDKIIGNIEFRNVKFTYPTRSGRIFSGLSFKIPAGKQIGISGPSGCGKSTILQLLLRLYDVDAGEILIDEVNIREYDLEYLRKSIAIVSQEPVLFNGSVEYNLKYANEDVTLEELIDACKQVNALSFLHENDSPSSRMIDVELQPGESPIGFERLVGSKGSQISGGQKQRIAFARALLRKPKILLLDEATSALDTKSEMIVQNNLDKITKGLTKICIAHRISTIKAMDDIFVMKGGELVERGTFEELMDKEGYFYDLQHNE